MMNEYKTAAHPPKLIGEYAAVFVWELLSCVCAANAVNFKS